MVKQMYVAHGGIVILDMDTSPGARSAIRRSENWRKIEDLLLTRR